MAVDFTGGLSSVGVWAVFEGGTDGAGLFWAVAVGDAVFGVTDGLLAGVVGAGVAGFAGVTEFGFVAVLGAGVVAVIVDDGGETVGAFEGAGFVGDALGAVCGGGVVGVVPGGGVVFEAVALGGATGEGGLVDAAGFDGVVDVIACAITDPATPMAPAVVVASPSVVDGKGAALSRSAFA